MNEEILRYSKQIILPGIGHEGQKRLRNAKILVAGAGGLGSPALTYLAAAGVGIIGIADFDTITLSNLNRQTIYSTQDIGKRKTDVARDRILLLNPGIEVKIHQTRINIDNVADLIENYDVIIDATDNMPTRYLISDACYFTGKPVIEGAVNGYEGLLMTVPGKNTPCYRCLYPMPPKDGILPNCSNTGILGATTGVIGSLQALESIKIILGIGETVSGRVLTFNALTAEFSEIKLDKDINCPLCGNNPLISELVEYEIRCKTTGM